MRGCAVAGVRERVQEVGYAVQIEGNGVGGERFEEI